MSAFGASPIAFGPFDEIIERALREDIRSGDVTTLAVVPAATRGHGVIVAREATTCCGLDIAAEVFRRVGDVAVTPRAAEGDEVVAGTVIADVSGELRAILTGERTALNLLQRACGIATATRACVRAIEGTGVMVLDTRKTAPGLRALDKRAVRAGGGVNHRHALDDMVLVKDNHVAAAGSLARAVELALAAAGRLRVEVEVDSLSQLDVLLALPRLPDDILLDNFTPDEVAIGVRRIGDRAFVEVSGGVTLANLRSYAEAGPDGISMGALTHSVRAADLALDLDT